MLQAFAIVGGSIAVAALLVCLFAWHEKVESDTLAMDPRFRLEEAVSGTCAACGGAGRRMEVRAGPTMSTPVLALCFRCGGTGMPPPPGVVRQRPKEAPVVGLLRRERDWLEYKQQAWRDR